MTRDQLAKDLGISPDRIKELTRAQCLTVGKGIIPDGLAGDGHKDLSEMMDLALVGGSLQIHIDDVGGIYIITWFAPSGGGFGYRIDGGVYDHDTLPVSQWALAYLKDGLATANGADLPDPPATDIGRQIQAAHPKALRDETGAYWTIDNLVARLKAQHSDLAGEGDATASTFARILNDIIGCGTL